MHGLNAALGQPCMMNESDERDSPTGMGFVRRPTMELCSLSSQNMTAERLLSISGKNLCNYKWPWRSKDGKSGVPKNILLNSIHFCSGLVLTNSDLAISPWCTSHFHLFRPTSFHDKAPWMGRLSFGSRSHAPLCARPSVVQTCGARSRMLQRLALEASACDRLLPSEGKREHLS